MTFFLFKRNEEKCLNCGFCERIIQCPSPDECIGCESCFLGCPNEAIEKLQDKSDRKYIKIRVNGESFEVPERITVKRALELLGYKFGMFPGEGDFFTPCQTGGCYSCAVIIDGKLRPPCHTPIKQNIEIITEVDYTEIPQLRIVSGYMAHSVGGVGTPYWLKPSLFSPSRYIEVAVFSHGCNLRCRQCQNFSVAYGSDHEPVEPDYAATMLSAFRDRFQVDRMAISGGEPTLNRYWLIKFFKRLKESNPDEKARLHLDTNATILTPDYLDELFEAGVTDIGPDLKGSRVETFMNITNIMDYDLAKKYLTTSWNAVKYIVDNYDHVFIGVGIPYNSAWMSFDELREIGDRLVKIDENIQVCALDYRPIFRRRDIRIPSVAEMLKVKTVLESTGLKIVLVQTQQGHFGP